MFTLHHFQNLRAAQAFSDYLNAIHINNRIQDDEFSYQILVEQDSQRELATKELEQFLQTPNDNKYLSASWQTGTPILNAHHWPLLHSGIATNFISHGGLLSHSVFLICLLIYALTSLGFFNPMHSAFAFFTVQPFDYSQSWRFITPVFLHFSMLHIVFNLLWWWDLAGLVEKQHGKLYLSLLFFVTAITSNLAQYYLVSPYFGGLSGVVYGLVGYCWLFGIINKNSKVKLPNSYFALLLGWLVLGFINLLPVNVANYAHLAGLLAGLLLAGISSKLTAAT
jgi:GlpG protein